MYWLIILGAVFVLLIFALRFYFYKTMTNRVCSMDPDNDYCKKHYKKALEKSENQYNRCDVVYGETPSGGVKTVICYLNEKNNMVKKKAATKVLVRELDEKNHPVHETWTSLEEEN